MRWSSGDATGTYVVYQEGIYVGYRYYETRYADVVTGAANVGNYDYQSVVTYQMCIRDRLFPRGWDDAGHLFRTRSIL